MSLKPRRCRKALLTKLAAVRLLPSVCSNVHAEVGGAPEPPLTVGAGIRPFPRVDPFVEKKLTRGEESLAALGTLVRPFPRVSQIMPDERCRLGKPLSTKSTRKRTLPCVDVEVFTLGTLGFKALWTMWATEWPKVAVGALVSYQLSM